MIKEEDDDSVGLSLYLQKASNIIKNHMDEFQWVVFDIIEIKNSRSHYYLEIGELDENKTLIASSRATIWSSKASQLLNKFKMETGFDLVKNTKVMALCSLTLSPKFGLSINIIDINPTYTLGVNKSAIKDILYDLDKQGITNNNKRFPTPIDFKNIIVLSPNNAAGLGDFKADADKLSSFGVCNFEYHSAVFQGENAEKSIMDELRNIFIKIKDNDKYDAVVIIRGGGSTTDLNHLNSKSIARAICLFNIPVYVGIGHERDETVLDYVANLKFDTPSKVVGFIKNTIVTNYNEINNILDRIISKSINIIDSYKNNIVIINKDNLKNAINLTHLIEKEIIDLNNKISKSSIMMTLSLENYLNNYKSSILAKSMSEINKNIEFNKNIKDQIRRGFSYLINNNIDRNEIISSKIIKLINQKCIDELNIIDIKTNSITSEILKIITREININELLFQKIDKHNPIHIKKIGYGLVRNNKKAIKSINGIEKDSKLTIEMIDGLIYTNVLKTEGVN